MTDKIHVHLGQESKWSDKLLADVVTDYVTLDAGGLVLYVSPAEIHDWRYDGGDADSAKWLAMNYGTEGDNETG